MNDEIKLDHFKNIEELKQNVETWIKEDEMYWNRWFSLYDLKTVLDYITNLQEENEDLKDRLKVMKHFKNSLQEENERLKKENIKLYKKDTKIINELKEELEITQEKWNKDKQWSECRTKEWLDYKSRCEKATELIEKSRVKATPFFKQFDGDLLMPKREVDKLLNILNSDDKEN